MATTEHTINDALAEVLMETRSLWRVRGVVRSENLGLLTGSTQRPDILVAERHVSPVIVETEIVPAVSVEEDAKQRLGQDLAASGHRILSSLAVKLPARLRDLSGQLLKGEIRNASDFEMALFTGESPELCARWPRTGWLSGNASDLSVLIQSASVPPTVIEEAANRLESGVKAAASLLVDMVVAHPGAIKRICEELRQQDSEQTRRMAMTILANALVFHDSLSHGHRDLYDVRTLAEHRSMGGGLSQHELLEDWCIILGVNYWPVFDIARRILEVIPADTARLLLDTLVTTANELVINSMMKSHDLTGAVFQRLIADRKFLAAFYTHPASAALLVGLAVNPHVTPAGGSWASDTDLTSLRIADFACGTGTLLSAAYRRISQLHESFGGDAETIHPEMMRDALVGCDVLPVAAHLTASMLTATHPTVSIEGSSIMTVGFGPRPDGGFALGSLDLLDLQRPLDVVAITAKIIEGKGERERRVWELVPHWSFDLVMMNPPFTRDTNHEAARANTANPMFAAFGMTNEQQREMARASAKLLSGTTAHGNAGEASAFLALADRKLKMGGTLAMVMPISLMLGDSWENSRGLLRKSYNDLVLASIAGAGRKNDMAFSADTSIAECLVVGRKVEQRIRWHRATFAVLYERPTSTMTGASIATQIYRLKEGRLRKLDEGPVGGSLLHFGDDVIGYVLDAPVPQKGPWNLARIKDCTLAQVAYQMAYNSLVWLPGTPKNSAIPVPITVVSEIGNVGPVHRDINGTTPDGGIRGPFNVEPVKTQAVPTYPTLWWHDANRERCMQFEADSEGIMRQGANPAEEAIVRTKAARVWKTASHCHFNADFGFSSESTGMQFTNRKSIGGRAWPSIALASIEQEKALVLWSNSSLGLLLRWWHSNKQQPGRGSIGVSALTSLPVLDVTRLSAEALAGIVAIFDDIKHRELRPINEIAQDAVRAEVDTRLAIEVLRFPADLVAPDGPLALLRQKLALEPSITGSKRAS